MNNMKYIINGRGCTCLLARLRKGLNGSLACTGGAVPPKINTDITEG